MLCRCEDLKRKKLVSWGNPERIEAGGGGVIRREVMESPQSICVGFKGNCDWEIGKGGKDRGMWGASLEASRPSVILPIELGERKRHLIHHTPNVFISHGCSNRLAHLKQDDFCSSGGGKSKCELGCILLSLPFPLHDLLPPTSEPARGHLQICNVCFHHTFSSASAHSPFVKSFVVMCALGGQSKTVS